MFKIISAVRRFFFGLNSDELLHVLGFIAQKPAGAIEIAKDANLFLAESYYLLDELERDCLITSEGRERIDRLRRQ